jgi:hypothetical protein
MATSVLLTARFWADAVERAVKTAAQTALATGVVGATDVASISWPALVSASAVGALASILTSIASAGVTDTISPASIVPPGL